jgi:hypothetical protein
LSKYNKEEWSKISKQGKPVYIITHWILATAFPVAIVLPIIRGIFRERNIGFIVSLDFIRSVLLYLLLCMIISVILGLIRWGQNEKAFKQ